MATGIRYRLDSSWRRPGDGKVVIAGSPLRLFRLSTGGAQAGQVLKFDGARWSPAVDEVADTSGL
ncbi:MAG: hypothetical protein ABMA25_21810, partial [Ilumatobacteraceae bacterium]